MSQRSRCVRSPGWFLLALIGLPACGATPASSTADASAAAAPDGSAVPDATPAIDACPLSCGTSCCTAAERCLDGLACVRDLGPCGDDGDCGDDSYCDATMRCTPYQPGHDRNPACTVSPPPGIFRTRVQCEWTAPPPGDPFPDHVNVESTPLVVDFRIGAAPGAPPHPSVVFVATNTDHYIDGGVLRIVDGATCSHQFTISDPMVQAAGTPAVGDLDSDGRADIVSAVAGGGVAAWGYDGALGAFRLLWRSADTSARLIHALSLADLDDDGVPEVLAGSLVYRADGSLAAGQAGQCEPICQGHDYPAPAVVADVDLDGAPEIVRGASLWTWDPALPGLVPDPTFVGARAPGATAVADFGDFPGRAGDAAGRAEIVSISAGSVLVETVGGDVVFGPVSLPGGPDGGNPTVADFDGDGVPELATGGPGSYTVFDLACTIAGGPGLCGTARTDGILWSRTVQDTSCGINGSTVFDFEGDGKAEVVYADECYLRLFDGATGDVVWSRRRSSATWMEAPIVADVDGDFRAELVSGATGYWDLSCASPDPIDPGLRCQLDDDCPTPASACIEGLCRCVADADCGDSELGCVAPLPGTTGEGNVCRATFGYLAGIRVYSDVDDRWAGSRPIWNQHAYAVTNVNDDGTVPKTSEMAHNWLTPGLNNFRENVELGIPPDAAADLTVSGVSFGQACTLEQLILPLTARVCNRGLLTAGPGASVVFYAGDPGAGASEACRATTMSVLASGECEEVSCDWLDPPVETLLTVHLRLETDAAQTQCLGENDWGTLPGVRCPPPIQ